MKIIKKIILILVSLLVVLFLGTFIYINIKLPDLPLLTNKIIDNALAKGARPIEGKQGYAHNDGTKIWYNEISPKDSIKGNILLIMGIANDALAWPDYFIKPLVDSGYRVIRFDNRGTGMSDWNINWTEENAYSLDDMADDVIAILDTLQIDKVHVIGASLGGMIAQTMSINYPHRVLTLTSMMSTGNIMDKELPPINQGKIFELLLAHVKYGLVKSETNQIKLQLTARLLLMGDTKYEIDVEDIANSVLYNLRNRRGYNPDASKQHIAATLLSGSRYEEFATLEIPTLVIHGTTDPLIDFKHGEKTHTIIPNSKNIWVEGMGHDIPPMFVDIIILGIIEHIENYEDE
ncbi:MAG: alpha/beta hydrolase [Bacteroidetes bacterium]|nr:alpha/beta hydrolase [Bacteroidota bacterium]MBL6944681.1 alpha/beta hydrolase [Bacteroidales bacterium]